MVQELRWHERASAHNRYQTELLLARMRAPPPEQAPSFAEHSPNLLCDVPIRAAHSMKEARAAAWPHLQQTQRLSPMQFHLQVVQKHCRDAAGQW